MDSLVRKQLAAGLALTVMLFCLVNHYLDLGIFGRYSKQILTLSFAFLGITALACVPTAEEEGELTRKWRKFWSK